MSYVTGMMVRRDHGIAEGLRSSLMARDVRTPNRAAADARKSTPEERKQMLAAIWLEDRQSRSEAIENGLGK